MRFACGPSSPASVLGSPHNSSSGSQSSSTRLNGFALSVTSQQEERKRGSHAFAGIAHGNPHADFPDIESK